MNVGTPRVLAIDGPAGAGKSTVSHRVAAALGLEMLDTGAMYRAVTLAVLRAGIDPADGPACARTADGVAIDVGERVTLDGQDVTGAIRTPEVTAAVSAVSAHAGVRAVAVRHQREWAARRAAVLVEGRDIGSVVFPDATLKVYLTASTRERAERRLGDERAAGREISLAALQADIERRDLLDSTRAVAPLTLAPDAVVVDSTGRTIDDVVQEIVQRFNEAVGERG